MGAENKEDMSTGDMPALVIISNAKNFILDSIMEYMHANNVSMKMVELKEEAMSTYNLRAKYILIKADDFIDINYGCLIKIKRYCLDNNRKIIILGYSEQIEKVEKLLDADIVAMEMVRQTDLVILKKNLLTLIYGVDKEEKPKKTILAVDDSGLMLRTLKSWLENDYELVLANSAAKAMSLLDKPKPDLILLDYEMPVCSGAQFFQMIQAEEHTNNIPVIFLTSKDDKETVTEVLNLRPAGYILKTTTKEQLLSKICQVLDKFEEK